MDNTQIDNIETTPIVIDGDTIVITPTLQPTTLSIVDYKVQLQSRIDQLTQSQTTTQAQLDSINQALSDAQGKLTQLV